jgi:hypothetical protein
MSTHAAPPVPIAVVPLEELRSLVREAVREVLAEHAPPAERSPELLDRAALARELGCSVATLRRLMTEGLPVELYVGNSPRFTLDRAREWLEQRGQRGTSTSVVRLISRGGSR